jgi:hypothetical protein
MGWTHTRSRIAHALKADPDADVTELRRQLKAEKMADEIEAKLAAFPSLTRAQRLALCAIITDAGTPGSRAPDRQRRKTGRSAGDMS